MCRWCGCSCDCGGARSKERAVPVEGMLEAVLLLLLAETPRYGYEVWGLLGEEELLAGRVYPGRIYETLRRLAENGFVAASTEESTKGPARARYAITAAGSERLVRWKIGLQRSYDRVGQFLMRFDQLGLRGPPAAPTGDARRVSLTSQPSKG